jgi:hypothetical protein
MEPHIAERLAFKERTGEQNQIDWILDDFKGVKGPAQEFVRDLPLGWPPFKEGEATIAAIVLAELSFPSTDKLEAAVALFLKAFSDFRCAN